MKIEAAMVYFEVTNHDTGLARILVLRNEGYEIKQSGNATDNYDRRQYQWFYLEKNAPDPVPDEQPAPFNGELASY